MLLARLFSYMVRTTRNGREHGYPAEPDPRTRRVERKPKRAYCVADFSPRRRMRSCSFLRSGAGALGLNATRYQSGCERSRLRRESVAASLLGWRAIFSRIAEYG